MGMGLLYILLALVVSCRNEYAFKCLMYLSKSLDKSVSGDIKKLDIELKNGSFHTEILPDEEEDETMH